MKKLIKTIFILFFIFIVLWSVDNGLEKEERRLRIVAENYCSQGYTDYCKG